MDEEDLKKFQDASTKALYLIKDIGEKNEITIMEMACACGKYIMLSYIQQGMPSDVLERDLNNLIKDYMIWEKKNL